jgi:hypothetical protein
MRANGLAAAVVGTCLLACGVSQSQEPEVIINGQKVTAQQIKDLQTGLGIPENAQVEIPPGRYWYDPVSGLWGMEGGPTQGQILPYLQLGGQLQPDASGGGTNVFINGREIHMQEVEFLRGIFGYVNPGRYWLNWEGIGGYEGGPALFNLAAAMAATGGSGYTRRTPFGSIGGDGNCSYYMHPSGSSVMNCGG